MTAPKLRFKEFDGDWTLQNLGDSFSLISGYAFPSSSSVDVGARWLKIADVGIQEMTPNNPSYLPLEYLDKYSQFIVSKNDYVIALTRPILNKKLKIAKVGELYDGALLNQRVAKIYSKTNNLEFIYSLLQKSKTVEELENSIAGTDPPNLSLNDVKEIKLGFPSKEEQMKIASFLTAVDEKISQLSQKLHLLGQYKQGMMQKLFSQQIRFKADDGSEFGEWDEYSLDTLLSKIIDNRGKTPVTEANLEIPLIEVNAIGQRRIKYEKVSKYFSEDTFQNWFRAYLEHQDILFSTVGNTAICSIYTDEIKAGIAQNIVGLRANTKLIQPTFLYYLLTEISNNQKFKSIEMQAVQPSIKVSQMIHLTFLTPCLEEQTKIANFLSSIDQKIEVTAQQIEQAKQWKKGLLQQMFV